MRRFAVDRVYREKKIFGFTPREFFECAFDIVSPTKGMSFNETNYQGINMFIL